MQYHYKQTVKENNKNTKHSSYGRQKERAVVTSHTVVSRGYPSHVSSRSSQRAVWLNLNVLWCTLSANETRQTNVLLMEQMGIIKGSFTLYWYYKLLRQEAEKRK